LLISQTDPAVEGSVLRLFKLNAPEWAWLMAGFIGCALTGSIMPVFAFFYGEVFAVSSKIFWTLVLHQSADASYFLFSDVYFDWR